MQMSLISGFSMNEFIQMWVM